MEKMKKWIEEHPDIKEFILFNLLSNCATITNFFMMWVGTEILFQKYSKVQFDFLMFHYTNVESDLGLCGFLSFLIATVCAQVVNFFIQKNFVFRSDASFQKAVPKYIALAVFLVALSAVLPAYSQEMLVKIGIPRSLVPTFANMINIIAQVVITYPTMKFFIMKEESVELL